MHLPGRGKSSGRRQHAFGFTLIELVVVLGIAGILMCLVVATRSRPASAARKVAIDQLAAAIDEARTAAITLRQPVLLAIFEPASSTDGPVMVGLFGVGSIPPTRTPLEAHPLGRWKPLPEGVVFRRGKIDGLRNLMDEETLELSSPGSFGHRVVRAFAFTPRGALAWPQGSDPMALELGSGTYQDGEPVFVSPESTRALRIGRVIARPWKFD